MSLLVWLPLNKDLNNQGLGNCTITNDGATIDNNGKLGKCYNFDGTNDRINIANWGNPKSISIAFWFKRNANTGTRQFLFTAWNGVSIELGTSGNIFGKVSISGGEGGNASGGTITTDSGWVHVCYTFEDKVGGKMYINGELKQATATSTSINWASTSMSGYIGNYSNLYLSGKMNDFRLYDHALSAKEVEIVSRGLVAHYLLEGKKGFDNLLSNTGNLTKWSKESGVTVSWDSEKNMYKISDSAHTSSRWGIYQDLDITADITYTITCTLDGNSCGVGFGFYDSSISGFPSAVMSTSGTKIKQSYTITSGAGSTKCRIYLYTNCATSTVAWFSLPKLEVSSVATTWIPKSTDDEYNIMGYNNTTTEYDMSGYNYHGIKNKTMNIITDTAKYSVATIFDGSTDSIQIPFYEMLGSNTSATYSFSVWIYKTEIGSKGYQTILGGPSGFEFEARKQAETSPVIQLYSWGGGTAAYEFNKWNHIVFTRTSSGSKLYLNGELVINNGSAGTIPNGNYFIGSWRDTSSQNFQGRMSDFRIYASELTADQVKELYQSSASIDKNGNLFGYEFVEV